MANKDKHTIDSAIKSLSKKHDCKITVSGVMVLRNGAPTKANDLGNGSWGRIEFLRAKGLRTIFVESFN
jgi:hypothetical protein